MNKIYLFTHDQLKCNFCTNWFTVTMDFADQHRYSLNLCEECHKCFQYKVVHPLTREIYELKLLRTGVILDGRRQEAQQKLNSLLGMLKNKAIKCPQQQEIERQNTLETQLMGKVMSSQELIKQTISSTCNKLVNLTLKKSHKLLEAIDADVNQCFVRKEQLIDKLKHHIYNSTYASQQVSFSDYKNTVGDLCRLQEECESLTAGPGLAQIRQMLIEFLNLHLPTHSSNRCGPKQKAAEDDKENCKETPALRLRLIREKLTQNKLGQTSERHKRSQSSLRKSTNQLTEWALDVNSDNRSMLSRSRQSSKSRGSKKASNLEWEKSQRECEEYRDEMARLMREKVHFDSYMPVVLSKEVAKANKTYGEKGMLEYLVELKMKTVRTAKLIELISENLARCNFNAYLSSLPCSSEVQTVKFIKTSISDVQLDVLLFWLSQHPLIKTLVATNNQLTDLSVVALCAFVERHPQSQLTNIYLGNNYIRSWKVHIQIDRLKDRGVNVQV